MPVGDDGSVRRALDAARGRLRRDDRRRAATGGAAAPLAAARRRRPGAGGRAFDRAARPGLGADVVLRADRRRCTTAVRAGRRQRAREPGTVDEPVPAAGDPARAGRRGGAAGLSSPMAELPGARRSAPWCTACSSTSTSPPPTSRAGCVARSRTPAGSQRAPGIRPAELADALLPSLHTPLGPLAGGLRLRDVARRDRLDELDFELPLRRRRPPERRGAGRRDRRAAAPAPARRRPARAATPTT